MHVPYIGQIHIDLNIREVHLADERSIAPDFDTDMDPKVLLFDEPYRALDSLTKSVMHEALLEIYYKNKVTIFFITHDLEEAIFLGHRVAIMTTRPCKPKKLLTVDIPHPRDYGVLTSKRFRELMQETSEAVHEEARKAFQAGEKEG